MNRNVADAASTGDRRAALEAVRDHLAQALDESTPNVAANIAGQLRQVLADLDQMTEPDSRSALDDLAARRSARRGAGPDPQAGTGR